MLPAHAEPFSLGLVVAPVFIRGVILLLVEVVFSWDLPAATQSGARNLGGYSEYTILLAEQGVQGMSLVISWAFTNGKSLSSLKIRNDEDQESLKLLEPLLEDKGKTDSSRKPTRRSKHAKEPQGKSFVPHHSSLAGSQAYLRYSQLQEPITFQKS